jgi:6-pyruvoyl-tetrahydropterin synthase
VELGLYLPIDETSGMALDFKKMNEFLKMDVLARFDHRFLNDITELGMSPTAEVLAHEILKDALAFFKCPIRVRLWETPDSWVEVGSDGLS